MSMSWWIVRVRCPFSIEVLHAAKPYLMLASSTSHKISSLSSSSSNPFRWIASYESHLEFILGPGGAIGTSFLVRWLPSSTAIAPAGRFVHLEMKSRRILAPSCFKVGFDLISVFILCWLLMDWSGEMKEFKKVRCLTVDGARFGEASDRNPRARYLGT